MKIFAYCRTIGLSATLAVICGILLGGSPAQAYERPIDITGYKVADVVITDEQPRQISVTAKTKTKSNFLRAEINADIVHRGKILTGLVFQGRKYTASGVIYPADEGLGVYKVVNGEIWSYYSVNPKKYGTNSERNDYIDKTATSFYVRGKTQSALAAKRMGSKVKLTATAKVFSPEKNRYAQYNPKNAQLQVKSGNRWKKVANLKLNRGTASVTVNQRGKKSYRLYVPQATWATSTTSKSVAK
jgi:hypothetical protein